MFQYIQSFFEFFTNKNSIQLNKIQKKGGTVKNNSYTLKDVQKHNKENDAWIILHNNVYNITEWIPKHPGGPIIKKYIGKDATQVFESIPHPSYVIKNVAKKYLIGKLKK